MKTQSSHAVTQGFIDSVSDPFSQLKEEILTKIYRHEIHFHNFFMFIWSFIACVLVVVNYSSSQDLDHPCSNVETILFYPLRDSPFYLWPDLCSLTGPLGASDLLFSANQNMIILVRGWSLVVIIQMRFSSEMQIKRETSTQSRFLSRRKQTFSSLHLHQ